jgi:WW domain
MSLPKKVIRFLLSDSLEILEYARYLGMDPDEDHDLLYIAKEGLKAPLPENWKPCKTREGDIYYFNFDSRQSQWEHPCDEFYKKKYTEAKSKKTVKKGSAGKTESKFKKNLPPGKNGPGKNEGVIPNKSGKAQNVPYQQQSAETSFSADNQSSFTIANQASPFSSSNPKGNSKKYIF